jgi:hypothetical protein
MNKPPKDPVQKYLASIGSRGGKVRAARHDAKTLSRWGKLGGRPRKNKVQTKKEKR